MAEGEHLKMDKEHNEPPTSMNLVSPEKISQVEFTNVQHYYPLNTDVECCFQKLKNFQSGNKDWIGIFKVGWQTTKEYYTWISASSSRGGYVLFKAYYMPKDDEYYQFCYVDQTGEVRGISTPFEFRAELIEEDNDIMLVTTEEEINKINEERRRLEEENKNQGELIQNLQAELRSTSEKIKTTEKKKQDLQAKLQSLEEENDSLKKNGAQLEQYKTKVQDLLFEIKEMNTWKEKKEAEEKLLQQALENTSGLMEKYKEEVARLEEEHKAQMTTLETEQKLKAHLQHLLDDKNKKLVDKENDIKELETKLRSFTHKMTKQEEKLASLESENITKGEEEKKLHATIAQLGFEVTKLRDDCKQHLRIIEKETKENGSLEEILDRQNKKLSVAEAKIKELQTQLTSDRKKISTLEHKLAVMENENRMKTEKIKELQCTIALRKEEIKDLNTSRMKTMAEITELNRQLREVQLSTATSSLGSFPSQASSLYFGNPYEGPSSSIVRENEPLSSSETTLLQDPPPPSILVCPVCCDPFSGNDVQVYQDHVMCHTHDEISEPQHQEFTCPKCFEKFMCDEQTYNDHMMCHNLVDMDNE